MINSKKQPIVLVGCSFTYGTGLENEQTFANKLQRYTKRKVYNRGRPCWGIQHTLYQLRNDTFFKEIKPPEYIIYVFIDDHIRRMYVDYFAYVSSVKYLKYQQYNGKLKQNISTVTPIDYLKVTMLYKKAVDKYIQYKCSDEKFELLELYLIESKKEVDRLYNGTKFVVIKYPSVDLHGFKPYETDRWKELENKGFIIIDFDKKLQDKLISKEYLAYDGIHPSEKAWDIIIPIITKKLNL